MLYTFSACSTKYKLIIEDLPDSFFIANLNQGRVGKAMLFQKGAKISCRYICTKMDISIDDVINIMAFVYTKFPNMGLVDEVDLQHWMHARLVDDNRAIT